MTLRPARPGERRAALTLLYHYLPADERARRVALVRGEIARHEIPADGLRVAVAGRRVVGAVLAIPLAGACALLYPPVAAPGLGDQLLEEALAWLRGVGTRIVQAQARTEDLPHFAALPRHGFAHLGRLWYLHHDLTDLPEVTAPPFRLVPCSAAGERFGRALLASYDGTLDFPELSGVRTLAEILDGHRAATLHDPDLWWLIEADGQDAGVALLSPLPEGAWDLSYLGLVPAARGRGLGRAVLAELLRRACRGSAMRLTLAVDERNTPAWHLYRGAGFVPDEAREVFLLAGLSGPP